MKLHWRGLMLAVILFSCSILFSEDKPWIEVRSSHFRLMTNGSDRSGRNLVRQFELMRAVFEAQFPGFKLDAPARLSIIAPRDEYTARQLLPEFWAHSGPKPAGLYLHGWEREYAIVRLESVDNDRFDPDTYHVVYHEYVHSLLHNNFRWLPPWLDEGLAEFYGYTRFEKEKMFIGAPPRMARKVEFLQEKSSIPLAKFIESPVFSHDDEKTRLSYMQAWALTHFLTFGPGMKNGQLLNRFFNELQHGVEQKKAFLETFGSFEDVQNRYEAYIQHFAFSTAVMPEPPQLQQDNFAVRTMSLAETHAEIAAWLIRRHHWDQARELTDRALNADPKLSLAEEDHGFLQFNEGKDDEAVKDFSAAVDLDPKNYVALFAKTMISSGLRSSASAEPGTTDKNLERVLEIKPDFVPAYVELAKLAILKNQLDLALGLSRKAEQLEPFRAGYHILTGMILLRMNHPTNAAAEAAYVAQRWSGPDRDEALELWNKVPAEQRGAEIVPLAETQANSQTAEGIVKSVSCDAGNLQITLDIDGQPRVFKSKVYAVGFSDTLWFGSDHFSPCVHVQHLRAVLHYNASKDPAYSGDVTSVGFRDDLPSQTNPATAQASAH